MNRQIKILSRSNLVAALIIAIAFPAMAEARGNSYRNNRSMVRDQQRLHKNNASKYRVRNGRRTSTRIVRKRKVTDTRAGEKTRALQSAKLKQRQNAPTQGRMMVNPGQFKYTDILWHKRGTKTATKQKAAASKSYNKNRQHYANYKSLAARQMDRYKKTGNPKQLQWAQANKARAVQARVRMVRAQVRGLKAKAKIAIKTGNPDRANRWLDKAARLSRSADRADARLKRIAANAGVSSLPPQAHHSSKSQQVRSHQSTTRQPRQQVADGENPITQQPKAQRYNQMGLATGRGKRTAKLQLKSGNVLGAMDTLRRMEAQPNRRGLGGLVDRYRKWSTKRTIVKQSYKMGKRAARAGDMQLASEAIEAQHTLRKPGFWTNRKINAIGNQAIKGARSFSKGHRPEEAARLLSFARNIQQSIGKTRPTIRFRVARYSAKRRLWKDLKARAKNGNVEAFRSAMKLASAYAREDGRQMKKGDLGKVRKLYMKALKNSVPRALADAQMLLSGRMGYVNVEEAANRYAYAYDTANMLANRGEKIKTGLFHRGIESKFTKTRKQLLKAMDNQGSMLDKRPGLLRRAYEKIFVQAHRRTQPTVAPLNSNWVAQQQRAQEMEMARMAAEQQGMGAQPASY